VDIYRKSYLEKAANGILEHLNLKFLGKRTPTLPKRRVPSVLDNFSHLQRLNKKAAVSTISDDNMKNSHATSGKPTT